MKSFLKKCGAFVCRSLLNLIQSTNGKYNYIKIGLLLGTLGLYTLLFSWKVAILLMVAIGWHESGHVWAMKRVGISTRGFYFVPFMGGIAISDGNYKSLRDKVVVAIMGPIWGMILAFVTWIAYLITDSPFLGVAAYWQSMLNLFNLMPANPLDGGQIFRSILTSFNKKIADIFACVSIFGFMAMFVFFKSPVFLFATYLAGRDFWAHYKHSIESQATSLSRLEVIITVISYILLCGILLLMMILTTPAWENFGTLILN